MRAGYGEKLRKYFIKHNPIILIDLGPSVFESATVDTNILIISKDVNKKQLQAVTLSNSETDTPNISEFLQSNSVMLSNLTKNAWFIGSDAEQKLKEKIERIGKPLKEWDVKINYGIKTGLNKAFIIDTPTKERLCKEDPKSAEIIKPILRGRDIKRYGYKWAGFYVIIAKYGSYKTLFQDYPAIYRHLIQFESALKQRGQCRYSRASNNTKNNIVYSGQHHWLELDNNPKDSYLSEFEKEKVMWGNIAYNSSFVLLGKGVFLNAPGNIITSDNVSLRYLLGCLNSSIFNYEFQKIGIFLGHAFEWKKQYVEQVHIRPLTAENRPIVDKIEKLVGTILSLKNSDLSVPTTAQEHEINQLAYQLYALTDDEIEIIENFHKKA